MTMQCLVIDDSDVIRRVVRAIVEGLGLEVREAAAMTDAIATCRAKMPDIILLDWHLPGTQTLDGMVSLRALAGGRNVKIIYVTTNNDAAEIGRAIAAGACGYMLKPFNRETLETAIVKLIDKPRPVGQEAPAVKWPRRSAMAR